MNKLYYVYDPMCSWCWGFKNSFEALKQSIPPFVEIVYVLGGLAPDSDVPMAIEMQKMLQEVWKKVAITTGATFNHEFWTQCHPRRSTYPACRAVLAAKMLGKEEAMMHALQEAYYLRALNPSDTSTHLLLAQELGLAVERFHDVLISSQVEESLQADIARARALHVKGFPALVLETAAGIFPISVDYLDEKTMLKHICLLS